VTRDHDVRQLTTADLERTMRDLRANLSLISPDSPAHVPILAHVRAIDVELAGRAGNQQPSEAAPRQRATSWPVSRDPSGRR
jgi:hypothetical protein